MNIRSLVDRITSVWRTSTPEPTTDGIIWTYLKDVTRYLPLFAEPGTFILELDNIVETGLNGEYASGCNDWPHDVSCANRTTIATLSATFYASSEDYPAAPRANTIMPVTTLANNTGDDASVPPIFSVRSCQSIHKPRSCIDSTVDSVERDCPTERRRNIR